MLKYAYNEQENHPEIIFQIVKGLGCRSYLELGIWDASTIAKIREVCENCVGVDIKDQRKYFNFTFKCMDTDSFFANNEESFDVIFIDADHKFESAKKDFINSLKILNKHGIIFIHDTDPIRPEYLDFGYCGDSYRMLSWIEEKQPGLESITLPVGTAGLTIVKRKIERRTNNFNT